MKPAMRAFTAFAPATVSNVGCGFDVLGFALDGPGDEVTARFADAERRSAEATRNSGRSAEASSYENNEDSTSPSERSARLQPSVDNALVIIDDISGDDGRLPRDATRNTAAVAARALLDALGERRAVALSIRKGLPLASGLGGSAASAAAAVVAVDALLEAHATMETLFACAFEGERLGAGSAHGDNVAPAVYGGFVLVRNANPPDIVRLPVPGGLTAVVVHPDFEIETARARAILGGTVPLRDATSQWANLGALVHALHSNDLALLSRALDDAIAEPRRASLVPGLADIKRAALEAGALGSGLSGSGPSLFALCASPQAASPVAEAMTAAVRAAMGGRSQTYVSPVASKGARIV
jgi:homoserine kinase